MWWGLGGPKVKKAPKPLQRGPGWSQSEGGPRAHAAGALVVKKAKEAPGQHDGGLAALNAKEAPVPMRRGPRWSKCKGSPRPTRRVPRCSQRGGGPRAHAAGASVVPK